MDCLLPGLSIAGICWKLNGSRPGLNAFVKLSCPICLWRWNLKFQSNHFLMWTFEFWFVRCSRDTSGTFSKLVERLHSIICSQTHQEYGQKSSSTPPREMVPWNPGCFSARWCSFRSCQPRSLRLGIRSCQQRIGISCGGYTMGTWLFD